jgi:hypothetical protein
MSISDDPVIAMSDEIVASPGDEAGTWILDLGSDSLVTYGYADDLQLMIGHPYCRAVVDADVFDHSVGQWRQIESKDWPAAFLCNGWWGVPTPRLLLSMLGHRPITPFLDKEGVLRFRGSEIRGIRARAVRYREDHQPVFASDRVWERPQSLACGLGRILRVCWYPNDDRTDIGDSVFVFSLDGRRIGGYWLPDIFTLGMACDDQGLTWLYGLGDADGFTALDSVGQQVAFFPFPGRLAEHMAFANGLLWVVNKAHGEVLGIDPELSVESGEAAIVKRFMVFWDHTFGMTARDTTLLVSVNNSIIEYSLRGDSLTSWPYSVTRSEDIAWDGEALWMLHYGSPAAPTDATLLSRFRLE